MSLHHSRHGPLIAGAIVLLLLAAACSSGSGPDRRGTAGTAEALAGPLDGSPEAETDPESLEPVAPQTEGPVPPPVPRRVTGTAPRTATVPTPASEHTSPVVGDEITVVYYWRGDRTRTSPFLKAAGIDANVQEDEAFLALVDYANEHAEGGTLMGLDFDLHGRTLRGVVIEAGDGPEQNVAAAERIAKEIEPFAAIAGTGSISAYTCRILATGGVFNLGTYEVEPDLAGRTDGWCIGSAASFDAQVDAVVSYVSGRVAKDPNAAGEPRTFGIVYSEYPGLAESVQLFAGRLQRRGVEVVAVESLSASLSTAQQQSSTAVARMRASGVDTIIIPDAGAPMAFLPVAEAQTYQPDYVIWPCSGQDVPAMVRLYETRQWERAQGLTCYDPEFGADLTLDAEARATEWYAQYRSVRDGEPPGQTPYIYAQFLPLLAGITNAGTRLTPASFLEGLRRLEPYRYSAVHGRTIDERSALVDPGGEDRSLFADFTVLRWSNAARRRGSAVSGAYVFPEEGRRYPRDHPYS